MINPRQILAGILRSKTARRLLKLSAPFFLLIFIFLLVDWFYPLPAGNLFPPVSTTVWSRTDQRLRTYTARDDIWRIRSSLNEISQLHQKMVLAYEDHWFFWHPGINPVSIIRAVFTNLQAGKIVLGGSTITMQIARMIEPKSRTVISKLQEVFRALQLEWHFSKDELLEIYFNLTPYGGNIEGVGAATLLYFDKPSRQLSVGEIALLTALPNSPTQLRPDVNGPAARKARNKVLKRLWRQGTLSDTQYRDALSESIPEQRQTVPFLAPHFCDLIRQKFPGQADIKSTLNLRIQTVCENLLSEHIGGLRSKGISNGAVVIIENPSHEVLALVGSADFFDSQSSGQVNGAVAPRSPGSALKPYVYALALDEGIISQKSILEDVPIDYSGYSPENFDGEYHGVVNVEYALAQSLNVPAINLTAALKKQSIYTLLKSAEFTTLSQPRSQYGLPIILGACEVKLLELCNLYSSLANGGQFYPYSLVTAVNQKAAKTLFSPEAAFIVTTILTQLERPDLPAYWEFSLNLPKVAWKTGTSYGHKDAWSIGYNPKYTVGVWVGNFSGKGVPELVGAEAAAPLLFDIFNAISDQKTPPWFEMPANLDVRQVCAISGMPATENCPQTVEELYVPEIAPNRPCKIHKKISIDNLTGCCLCLHCRQNREYQDKIFTVWPSKLATWMERNGYPIQKIPEHLPQCTSLIDGAPPIIRSPSENCTYILREGVAPEFQKILLDASASNDVVKIYWFIDGNLIASGAPKQKIFYTPKPGNHKLVCMDEFGRSTEMDLKIH